MKHSITVYKYTILYLDTHGCKKQMVPPGTRRLPHGSELAPRKVSERAVQRLCGRFTVKIIEFGKPLGSTSECEFGQNAKETMHAQMLSKQLARLGRSGWPHAAPGLLELCGTPDSCIGRLS